MYRCISICYALLVFSHPRLARLDIHCIGIFHLLNSSILISPTVTIRSNQLLLQTIPLLFVVSSFLHGDLLIFRAFYSFHIATVTFCLPFNLTIKCVNFPRAFFCRAKITTLPIFDCNSHRFEMCYQRRAELRAFTRSYQHIDHVKCENSL